MSKSVGETPRSSKNTVTEVGRTTSTPPAEAAPTSTPHYPQTASTNSRTRIPLAVLRDAFTMFDFDRTETIRSSDAELIIQSLTNTQGSPGDPPSPAGATMNLQEFLRSVEQRCAQQNSRDEAQIVFKFLLTKSTGGDALQAEPLAKAFLDAGIRHTATDISRMLRAMDLNEDGKVTLGDFVGSLAS